MAHPPDPSTRTQKGVVVGRADLTHLVLKPAGLGASVRLIEESDRNRELNDFAEIEIRLGAFARKISSCADRIQWYTEFHPSRHYRLSGNLVFTPADSRERELAVVAVQLDDERGWCFDATDEASVVMAEASVPASTDLWAVLDRLSAFLDEAEPLVAAAVKTSEAM